MRYERIKFQYRHEEKEIGSILGATNRPIYHIHVRKTAGTTINFAFFSNAEYDLLESFYEHLAKKVNHRIISNDKVFVGWNKGLINSGKYSYAFSHEPLHQLNLISDTFRFTCLRDPVKRVISLYNMMKLYQIEGVDHPAVTNDGKWLGDSFNDFLSNIPKEHLLNQLYMFSRTFDISEANDRLMELDKVLFTEDLENGLKEMGEELNWKLPISNQKTYGFKSNIGEDQIFRLREALKPEYLLLEKLHSRYSW